MKNTTVTDSVMRRTAQASLTRSEVAQIRYLRTVKKLSYRELAERFSTTDGNIGNIVNYRTWPDVQPANALARGNVTDKERNKMLRLFRKGHEVKIIAQRTNRSRRTVQRIVAEIREV